MPKKPKTVELPSDTLVATGIIANIETFAIKKKNWDGHQCDPLPKHIAVAAAEFIRLLSANEEKKRLPTNVYHLPNIPDRNGNVAMANGLLLSWVFTVDGKMSVLQSLIFHEAHFYYTDLVKVPGVRTPSKILLTDMFGSGLAELKTLIASLPNTEPLVLDVAAEIALRKETVEEAELAGAEMEKRIEDGTIYAV